MAIEKVWVMQGSDIMVEGKKLGYDWNFLCNEVKREGLHGQDGSGSITMFRDDLDEIESEYLKVIFRHIFTLDPDMQDIRIIDDN